MLEPTAPCLTRLPVMLNHVSRCSTSFACAVLRTLSSVQNDQVRWRPVYNGTNMIRTLTAVYENGVLRPLEPLTLSEHQQVSVTVSELSGDPADAWIDHEYMATVDAIQEAEPTLEEVRQALSKIPGNLSDDIRAERDSRG